ncbi:MAG: universal stress protein [Thermoplasmatota archaeon]
MTRLLVGYDGSPPSKRALEYAATRAKLDGAELLVATIVPASLKDNFFSTMLLPDIDLSGVVKETTFVKNAEARLTDAIAATGLPKNKTRALVLTGDAAQVLVEAAKTERIDEVILGNKSYEKLSEFTLGTIADKVTRYAPCTVTVVR